MEKDLGVLWDHHIRDKKVVGVFVRFRAPLQLGDSIAQPIAFSCGVASAIMLCSASILVTD
jgi:hypothetical protein